MIDRSAPLTVGDLADGFKLKESVDQKGRRWLTAELERGGVSAQLGKAVELPPLPAAGVCRACDGEGTVFADPGGGENLKLVTCGMCGGRGRL